MNHSVTVTEARKIFGENSYEIDGGFIANYFGKYLPNITFVVGKEMELDTNGNIINPIRFVKDREVTDGMNMDFDGDATFMFGDFWTSKKGGACFRPKDPREAKDLLIRVNWGGAFDNHRGTYSDEAKEIEGVKYFRRASSNRGGSGYDYWVVPVGFYRVRSFDGLDGQTKALSASEMESRAKGYREKHALLREKQSKENDTAYRAKLAAEEKSRQNRDAMIPRLQEIGKAMEDLDASQEYYESYVPKLDKLGDTFFRFNMQQYPYTEESLAECERSLSHYRELIAKNEAKGKFFAEVKADLENSYPDLSSRLEKIGWDVSFANSIPEYAQIIFYKPPKDNSYRVEEQRFPFDKDGAKAFINALEAKETEIKKQLRKEEAARQFKEAQEKAKALGLPGDIRIWTRYGKTNAGRGYVITPDGMDRPYDKMEGDLVRINRYGEGYAVWNQIMPGELVLEWKHAYTAAPHNFNVIYRPEELTEAQKERVAEIQNGIEEKFFGKAGLTGTRSCPSIGQGWGLFQRNETVPMEPQNIFESNNVRVFIADGLKPHMPESYYSPTDNEDKEAIAMLNLETGEITISLRDDSAHEKHALMIAQELWGQKAEGDNTVAKSPKGTKMNPYNLVEAVMKIEETVAPPRTLEEFQEMNGLRNMLRDTVDQTVKERGMESSAHDQNLSF